MIGQISVKRALQEWVAAGLLDRDHAERLAAHLERVADSRSRAWWVVSAFGGGLVGLGIILFVASHWQGMGPATRILTIIVAHLGICTLAFTAQEKGWSGMATALWFTASLAFGGGIFLIGQIFNFSLTFWQGPALWLVGVLFMAWAVQSRLQIWLAVPLLVLAVGWYGGGSGWFMDDQLEFLVGRNGVWSVLPFLGIALAGAGVLIEASPSWQFASKTLTGWGAFLVGVPLVLATMHWEVVEWLFGGAFSGKGWVVLIVATLTAGAAALRLWPEARYASALLISGWALWVLLIFTAQLLPVWHPPLFAIAVATFALSLLCAWAGVQSNSPALLNMGVVFGVAVVLVQYFSWAYALMGRSIGFILGGIVLLATSGFAENRRRALLRRMAA